MTEPSTQPARAVATSDVDSARAPIELIPALACGTGLVVGAFSILAPTVVSTLVPAPLWIRGMPLPLVFGFVIAMAVQQGVRPVFHLAFDRIAAPPELETFWTLRQAGSSVLGILEGILFFVSAWADAPVLAGAWLAFKLGSKWSSWQHVVRVTEDDSNLAGRSAAGMWISQRFLVGTLWNLLAGGFGAYVAKTLSQPPGLNM
jgi:hypothetical protein